MSDNTKYPFDLERALAGEELVTRDGSVATNLEEWTEDGRILIVTVHNQRMFYDAATGKYKNSISPNFVHDLFMKHPPKPRYCEESASFTESLWESLYKQEVGTDPVLNPMHYDIMPGVTVADVRDALLAKFDMSQWTAQQVVDWSNAFKYLCRCMDKGGMTSIFKAENSLHRMRTGEWIAETAVKTEETGWIEWNGGECPVDGNTLVTIKLRDDEKLTSQACCFEWLCSDLIGDIIAYKVHQA